MRQPEPMLCVLLAAGAFVAALMIWATVDAARTITIDHPEVRTRR